MKQKNMVLMVVAVGCGLGAAFLTSQMSAKPAAVETVEVLVAAKDLPVGTLMAKDDLAKLTKRKTFPKEAVPAKAVEAEIDLADKRLTRAVRTDESFNPADLSKGGVVSIPAGQNMTCLSVNVAQAVAGFVGPGSRVDVLASVRLRNQVRALPLLVNMLVLAVDTQTQYPKEGAFQTVSTVSFAADLKQALLIKLALARACDLSLLLRNPDEAGKTELDRVYDIDQVIKLLQDEETKAEVSDGEGRGRAPAPKPEPAEAPPPPKPATVRVPVAAADIPPGTPLTADLLADPAAFAARELPKELAADAVTDFAPYLGQTFRTGLGRGQWATPGLIAPAAPKPGVKDEFAPPKEPPAAKEPPKAAAAPPPAKPTHDVAVHTASGTRVYRYVEVRPGEWRLAGEVRPTVPPATAAAPDPTPDAPKTDRRID